MISKKIEKSENEFIDNFRSISSLLLTLVGDLSEINKKIEKSENKFIDNFRSMLASLSCLVDDLSEINKKISLIQLSEKFPNTYQLCNKDLNRFALLLRKGINPYEYMNSWERFNETSLPNKEAFYSELNKENITDMKIMRSLKKYGKYSKQKI